MSALRPCFVGVIWPGLGWSTRSNLSDPFILAIAMCKTESESGRYEVTKWFSISCDAKWNEFINSSSHTWAIVLARLSALILDRGRRIFRTCRIVGQMCLRGTTHALENSFTVLVASRSLEYSIGNRFPGALSLLLPPPPVLGYE